MCCFCLLNIAGARDQSKSATETTTTIESKPAITERWTFRVAVLCIERLTYTPIVLNIASFILLNAVCCTYIARSPPSFYCCLSFTCTEFRLANTIFASSNACSLPQPLRYLFSTCVYTHHAMPYHAMPCHVMLCYVYTQKC